MRSCARPDINDKIGRTHRIFIVLDHNQRIAQVLQVAQRSKQLVIVTLVQPDTWLIQNIGNAHKAGANLRRQADALSLAAGQRACAAAQ